MTAIASASPRTGRADRRWQRAPASSTSRGWRRRRSYRSRLRPAVAACSGRGTAFTSRCRLAAAPFSGASRSSTVAAARFVVGRLPQRACHQYAPVDLPDSVAHFLAHWRPDLAIWVESELWPNLVLATAGRGTPLLLANARLSAASLARWRRLPGLARPVVQSFALTLAQDNVQAERFRRLGADPVASVGDLNSSA